MGWSMDVVAGTLDICLGLATVVLIVVLHSRRRRRARSAAETTEHGA